MMAQLHAWSPAGMNLSEAADKDDLAFPLQLYAGQPARLSWHYRHRWQSMAVELVAWRVHTCCYGHSVSTAPL